MFGLGFGIPETASVLRFGLVFWLRCGSYCVWALDDSIAEGPRDALRQLSTVGTGERLQVDVVRRLDVSRHNTSAKSAQCCESLTVLQTTPKLNCRHFPHFNRCELSSVTQYHAV